MVQFLIEKGANLGLDRSGQQALCNAAHGGHESIVRLLVECGVDVDGTQEDSLLLYAFLDRQDQAAKALVELGAKRKDPLESEFVKRYAQLLADSPYLKLRGGKPKTSYEEYLLAYQSLDKALFPSGSAPLETNSLHPTKESYKDNSRWAFLDISPIKRLRKLRVRGT